MRLRTIAVSEDNYELLKKQGNAADSFNDVITALLEKVGITEDVRKN
jgi:predicted CopG family antitoxin